MRIIPKSIPPPQVPLSSNLYYNNTLHLNNFTNWNIIIPQATNLPLVSLELANNNIDDIGIGYVRGNWPDLKILDISSNYISKIGLNELLKNLKTSTQIQQLILYNNNLGDRGVIYVLELRFVNLKELWLGDNNMRAMGLRMIRECRFVELEVLDLDSNNIGSSGVRYLRQAHFPKLKRLHLQKCNINHNGSIALIKPQWPNLLQIGLTYNFLSTDSLHLLSTYSNWQQLQFININHNNIGEIGVQELMGLSCEKLGRSGCCYQSNLRNDIMGVDVVRVVCGKLVKNG